MTAAKHPYCVDAEARANAIMHMMDAVSIISTSARSMIISSLARHRLQPDVVVCGLNQYLLAGTDME